VLSGQVRPIPTEPTRWPSSLADFTRNQQVCVAGQAKHLYSLMPVSVGQAWLDSRLLMMSAESQRNFGLRSQLNWNQFKFPRLVVPLAGALNTTYKS